MSIQGLGSTQARSESRPAAGRAQTAGASFQDRLVQTAAQANPAPAGDPGRTAFKKDAVISSLSDFRTAVLDRMKKAKENEEEQEAWDKLMKYLDAWIESLREEADVRKVARAHAALTALQSEAKSDRPDLGDYLLGQLENMIV